MASELFDKQKHFRKSGLPADVDNILRSVRDYMTANQINDDDMIRILFEVAVQLDRKAWMRWRIWNRPKHDSSKDPAVQRLQKRLDEIWRGKY